MLKLILLLIIPCQIFAQKFSVKEIQQYEAEAKTVNIIRDNWGIPHVYGKTDANAVFGLLYAQCEDDFNRVEMNYIEKLGRLSEVNGETDIYNDLLVRLVIDSSEAISDYNKAPIYFKKLCDAFADGINYYIYKHPQLKPALLQRFKPWYALLWTDGSIGAISTAGLTAKDLKEFYGKDLITNANKKLAIHNELAIGIKPADNGEEENSSGSNGFAFAPVITANKNAILYINPHVTYYFRPEVQMVSDEGLNTYGAVTWGQFFIYQGFNEHCGWMHTSSQVDVSDAYLENVSQKNGKWMYEYEHVLKPIIQKEIIIKYKSGNDLITKNIIALFTQHGPIMGKQNGQWLSVKSFNRSIISLMQSWLRTKANNFAAFKKVLDLRANTSNNTVYADAEGNIAYWHGNYIPVRDKKYDWNKPVDGTIAATEWKGLHTVNDIIHVYNPTNGWLQNCNSTPFSVAGKESPKKEDYPNYMAPDGENFRGINAANVLSAQNNYTIEKVITAGYNTYLAFFEQLIPALIKAYNLIPQSDSFKLILKEPMSVIKDWDLHAGVNSVATTLAVNWGMQLSSAFNTATNVDSLGQDQVFRTRTFAATANAKTLIKTFAAAIKTLNNNYGQWEIPWGDINRFQRIDNKLDSRFDDDQPSSPIGFTSAQWGQLCSCRSASFNGTKKLYGYSGNSFICAVEFGKKIKAKSLLAGGESGNPTSKHFKDQAEMYSKGQFKDVLFYKEDVLQHIEKQYHPGE